MKIKGNDKMSRKRIFIGSSSESLGYAEKLKCYFSESFDCTIWNEDFFVLNKNTYETLLKKSIAFDYAIFVGGKDDFIKKSKNRKAKIAPRDNVYLEFGLYAGILSPARTFFVVHKDCKFASDLDGITLCLFKNEEELTLCCKQINKHIDRENKIARFGLLPSISFAIAYYKNFLKDVCYSINELKEVYIGERKYNISNLEKELKIVIPNDVKTNWRSMATSYYDKNSYLEYNVEGTKKFHIRLDIDSLDKYQKLSFVDLPQMLQISFETVDYIVGKDFLGEDEFLIAAKRKEVDSFVEALQLKINEDAVVKSIVSIVRI